VVGEEELTTGVPLRELEEVEGSAVDINIAGIFSVLNSLILADQQTPPDIQEAVAKPAGYRYVTTLCQFLNC